MFKLATRGGLNWRNFLQRRAIKHRRQTETGSFEFSPVQALEHPELLNPFQSNFLCLEGEPLRHTSLESAHHIFHPALGHFLHHFLHLSELLQQAVHVLDLGAGPGSNSPSP